MLWQQCGRKEGRGREEREKGRERREKERERERGEEGKVGMGHCRHEDEAGAVEPQPPSLLQDVRISDWIMILDYFQDYFIIIYLTITSSAQASPCSSSFLPPPGACQKPSNKSSSKRKRPLPV